MTILWFANIINNSIYIYIYIYMCVCVYVCVCVCVCIENQQFNP